MLSGDFLARDEEVCVFPSQCVDSSRLQKLGLWMAANRLDTTREGSRLTFCAKILSFLAVKGPTYDPHTDESSRRVPSQTRDMRAEISLMRSRPRRLQLNRTYKIHITLEITEVAKVPMVAGFLLVPPQVAGVDKLVPGMAVATGVVRGSVKGQAQNPVGGRSGDPVEGIPRKGKEIPVTDTGTSTLRCYRG